MNIIKDMDTTLVRLIDVGRLVEVSASTLVNLAPQFRTENAPVHLSQLSQQSERNIEVVNYMKELLRDQEVVTLLRRAPPKVVDGQWSLPVETCED